MARIVAFVLFLVTSNLAAAQDLVILNTRILDGTGGSIEQGSIVVLDGLFPSLRVIPKFRECWKSTPKA